MHISIIIPARNEAARIGATIDRARHGRPCEVIVADGGSADDTAGVARRHGATVVASAPGRGRQLNRGAAAATGDVFVFLHADTLLPPGYDGHVRRTLAGDGVIAGAFELRIDAARRSLRLIERAVSWRSRVRRMPYGDQALFMTRRTFEQVGGFPACSAMEDFELVRRLRRRGRIEIAPAAVVTSARRWTTCGVWRTTLLNQACVLGYRLGVPADRIAAWRDSGPGAWGGATHNTSPSLPGCTGRGEGRALENVPPIKSEAVSPADH